MATLAARQQAIKASRQANLDYCERYLLGFQTTQEGHVGKCLCLNCDGQAQIDLGDLTGLVDCPNCRRKWTLADFTSAHQWATPPQPIQT